MYKRIWRRREKQVNKSRHLRGGRTHLWADDRRRSRCGGGRSRRFRSRAFLRETRQKENSQEWLTGPPPLPSPLSARPWGSGSKGRVWAWVSVPGYRSMARATLPPPDQGRVSPARGPQLDPPPLGAKSSPYFSPCAGIRTWC